MVSFGGEPGPSRTNRRCATMRRMTRKPNPTSDDPAQSERFREAARELGPDETGEAFERAFKKVARQKQSENAPSSDRTKEP